MAEMRIGRLVVKVAWLSREALESRRHWDALLRMRPEDFFKEFTDWMADRAKLGG